MGLRGPLLYSSGSQWRVILPHGFVLDCHDWGVPLAPRLGARNTSQCAKCLTGGTSPSFRQLLLHPRCQWLRNSHLEAYLGKYPQR